MPTTSAGKSAALTVWNRDGWLVLIEFSHADISTQRIALAMSDVTSGGNTYTALPFEIELPTDDKGIPRGAIRISNVTRTIWNLLNGLDAGTPPQITIKLALESDPDTIEEEWTGLDVLTVTGSTDVIEAEMGHENRAVEPYPAQRLIPPFANWIAYVG